VELIGTFEPHNPFHPCVGVLEALNVQGVTVIDPGRNKGAEDMKIKQRLLDLCELCTPSDKHCVVLIANDKDFAHEVSVVFVLYVDVFNAASTNHILRYYSKTDPRVSTA
jgi:hypothetical protein